MTMASLQEIESQIERCEKLEYVTYRDVDENGNPIAVEGPEAAVAGLYDAWGTLRRQLWSAPYQTWANELKERCRRNLLRLSEEHDLVYFGEPDRWPATERSPAVH
jgi:hypothetical protein